MMNKLDKFTILTGSTGLVADTITIVGFATGAGLVVPNVKGFDSTPGGVFLFTGLIGFYSLTMIVWFLFRRKLLNPETAMFGFDELSVQKYRDFENYRWVELTRDSAWELIYNLIPVFGTFLHIIAHKSARVIFWIAVFVSLFPSIFWIYLLSSNALSAALLGTGISYLLAQYSTFFALALDKFFRSIYVDFSR
jgi:hypothetical protein